MMRNVRQLTHEDGGVLLSFALRHCALTRDETFEGLLEAPLLYRSALLIFKRVTIRGSAPDFSVWFID
jgi:hypothetical protein